MSEKSSEKPRTKMVSFRLTSDEYHMYRQACRARGAQSISELARVALQSIIGGAHVNHEEQIRELQERVKILSADIDRYAERLTTREQSSGAATQGVGQ
jgi:hypothetical protein